jgi:hypothetical protein
VTSDINALSNGFEAIMNVPGVLKGEAEDLAGKKWGGGAREY